MQINSHGKHIKATPPQPKVKGTNAGDGAVAGGEVEQVKPQRLLERLQKFVNNYWSK
jgi:hypothetical protein